MEWPFIARENKIPFYVAAPISTLDMSIASGEEIPIEQRSPEEVTHLAGTRISADVSAAHPAFDVTPARLITAIITERGVATAPFEQSLRRLVSGIASQVKTKAAQRHGDFWPPQIKTPG